MTYWYNKYDFYNNSLATTSNSGTTYRGKHYNYIQEYPDAKRIREEAENIKFQELVSRFKNSEMPEQYMRSVMGDFESQINHEDAKEEPQLFYFDPKGIVDKWP